MDLYSYRLPLGVCAGIAPFNFPAMIPLWMFPMAMVCGNTFLMKPSERVPGATMLLAKLLQDSGAPDGALNIIHGQHEGNFLMCLLIWLPKELRCSVLVGNFNVYLCACDSLCVCHIYWVPKEARSGHCLSWSWSFRCLWGAQYVCWKLNSYPLEEWDAFSTTEPSLQLRDWGFEDEEISKGGFTSSHFHVLRSCILTVLPLGRVKVTR